MSNWLDILKVKLKLQECKSPDELQKVYDHIGDWNSVIKDGISPCVDMFITVVWNWHSLDETDESEKIQIEFNYQEQSQR